MDTVVLPGNVRLGPDSVITGDYLSRERAFRLFRTRHDPGLVMGARCRMDGVMFNAGPEARIEIGDDCDFQDATLICALEIRIGSRVVISWHATVIDADFHPMSPAARIADAIACSPLAGDAPRPPFERRPIVVEDDVWIGPNATVLKGVWIGAGALVEPGAVVVQDVPPRSRVLGNPARVVGER